jgi:putative acetyltransferase
MRIRTETPTDLDQIRHLVAKAFCRFDEADLVDRIRADGDAVISFVAVDGRDIAGHVLFSRMTAPFRALGLAPVSVRPTRQFSGIGSRLIRAGLASAKGAGWQGVFVLGNPNYYRRFGFDPTLAVGFTCRYSGPHLMALALGAALPATAGAIEYAPAFRLLR